jgi:hypothetical protein
VNLHTGPRSRANAITRLAIIVDKMIDRLTERRRPGAEERDIDAMAR